MAGKAYLRAFGVENGKKIPLEKYGYKSPSEIPFEVVNSISLMKPQTIARLKRLFNKRAGSWLPLDRSGVWRYREFLPAFKPFYTLLSLSEGNTPIYQMKQCALFCGVDGLQAKHLGYNPTGSCKDLAMAAAITMAKLAGAAIVACASAGSASASMAAYAARAGIQSIAILPRGLVMDSKLSQCADYRATTVVIDGTLQQARDIVDALCEQKGIYNCSNGNPFCIEGEKTAIIEMLHQLDWEPPDWVVVPGGDMGTCTACGKALYELKTAGFITKIPRLAIIRPEGAPSFETRASELSISKPVHALEASWYLDYTNGVSVEVSETEIAVAKHVIGKDGIGSDPSSAVTVAGCKKMCSGGTVAPTTKSIIKPDDRVVCMLTGNMMNDPDYTLDFHNDSLYLNPTQTTTLTPGKRITTLGKFNRIAEMPADAGKVIEYLEKVLQI